MELLHILQPVMQANNNFSMMLCIRLCCICEGSIWPDGHAQYVNLRAIVLCTWMRCYVPAALLIILAI